jgi:DNA-binding transcriptional MerR regulator
MSLNNKPTQKLFYKISEVAEIFDINISAVRFWEKEFDILKPKKK